MIDINILDVQGFEPAIHGMRNPMNSWDRSDSAFDWIAPYGRTPCVGGNDLGLMNRLFKAGVEHRTYARMINVWMDINAPLYWWKEMDRYTVGKVQISTSTMHKIHEKEFTLEDFSTDHLLPHSSFVLQDIIINLNQYRNEYLKYLKAKTKPMKEESKRAELMKKYWWQMIQLLPSSYNQKRTVMISYETAMKIIRERSNHPLDEWVQFVEVLKGLPYMQEIMKDESSLETESEH